jgi:hypothetical protein
MGDGKSTRLAIVEQSLIDILDRLDNLPDTPIVKELRAKTRVYERAVLGWSALPPSEADRSEMLRKVLALNVEVMQAGRRVNPTT